MNSEIIGKPTSGDWGIVFTQVDVFPRHPGQLYEAAAYLLIFTILLALYRRTKAIEAPGRFIGLGLMMRSPVRIIIEFFKENQSEFETGMFLNMGQLLSIPLLIAGIILFARSFAARSSAKNGLQPE